MTITASDVEIINRRLARGLRSGRQYVETHKRLFEEVASAATLDLTKAKEAIDAVSP